MSNPGLQRFNNARVALGRALALLLICALMGCVSTRQRGDRAFKVGHFSQALDHYERAMEDGDHSPKLYTHAARAALRLGDFTLAERYYSRALRNGAGEAIARELAEFYIATSNYTQAVRVLQTILETSDRPQTVFNNLGAALMYAGAPLNAESYLMVAQQMNPQDPVPYVNLGVLYEKHLHKDRLALGFYQCFLQLSEASRQRGKVTARVAALKLRYLGELPEGFDVECGTAYQPAKPPSRSELKHELAERVTEAPSDDSSPPHPDASSQPAPSSHAPTNDQVHPEKPPIIIERMVTEPIEISSETAPKHDEHLTPNQALSLAEKAFAHHNYQEVVRRLQQMPAHALNAHAMGLLGCSLVEVGAYQEAQPWLVASLMDTPEPAVAAALLTVYRATNAPRRIERLCARFQGDADFAAALEACANRSQPVRSKPSDGEQKSTQ